MIKNNPIIAIVLFLSTLLLGYSAQAHTATADSSTGRVEENISTSVRTVKTNSSIYGYVGNVGAKNSVAVFCFQVPNYPSGEVIDSAEIAVFIHSISNTGSTLGNASLYGVRSSATAGIQTSDYTGGTELVSSMLASSAGSGYVTVSDTGSTPLVDWLAANAVQNEYIVLRMETDSAQSNYNRYNLSDESVSGEEPTLTFTSSAPASTSYDAVADSSSGRVYENTSTSVRSTSSSSGTYTYVGNVGANNSVAVLCFQLPDYPSGSTINAATLSAYVNTISNSPGDASVYGVRSSATAGIQTSDFSGGTLVVSDFITAAGGTGFATVEDTGSTPLVNWLDANAEPNEYVVFRVEPNTAETGYARYNLSDESVSGEEPALSFEIGSGGTPSGWGDVAWDPTPWAEADGVTWETMSTLNTEIQNTTSGGTLDLTGRYFRSLPNASHITISSPINIIGGYFSGATSLTWTSVGSGVYKASIDIDTLGASGLTMLEDPDATAVPQMAVFPAPPTGTLFEQSRMTSNPNWWILHNGTQDKEGVFVPGTIVNAVVHTADGDDVFGSKFASFTITDATMRSEVNAAIGGDLDSLLIIFHAGPNVIYTDTISSWNSTTGELTLASGEVARFRGYVEFALAGRQEFIDGENNAYAVDLANDEVFYKPTDGDPTGTGIAANPIIFKISTNGVTFTGSKFSGTNGRSAAAGMLVGTGEYTTTLDSCTFMLGNDGIRGLAVEMDLCQFSHLFGRGLIADAGGTITRNRFEHIDGSSIFVGRPNAGFDPDVAMASTVIEGNYFYAPTAAHGQGISLYQCTWQNATVRNNIFHSCARAISLQPYSGDDLSKRTRAAGVFRFENNLVWTSELPFPYDSGQSTVAFNGDFDTHLTSGEQDVFIRHNVVGADTDDFHSRVFNMTIHKFVYSNVWVDGNIAGSISAAEDEVGNLVHQRSANLLGSAFPLVQHGNAYGSTDLAYAVSSTVYDRVNLAAIGSAATAASDGGPVGVRWLAIPDPTEMVDLPLDWVDVALPQTLPTATGWSDAIFDTDDR